jgi:AraC-like DNA-binding protein
LTDGGPGMLSSAVYSFTDPDEYAATARATRVELTISKRGPFNAKLIRIDLHRLWMQRYTDNLPRIGYWANVPGRAIISFRIEPGPSLRSSGVEMAASKIFRRSEAQEYFQQSSGSACFGSMSLPVEEMVSAGAAIAGCDLTPPKDTLVVTPAPSAMARLQGLHAAAAVLAENTPEIIANPDAAHGLDQALIEALAGCLSEGEVREDRSAERRHTLIMRRFHRAVAENPDQPLYIPELCAAIGASGRTLGICCQEQLGMSPKQYLTLRRLHLARRALRDNAPGMTTVTDIATRYGFWQLGRFAAKYKSLFAESPSATLYRPQE